MSEPDDRREEQRDFLLRSLDDLEAELADGNIDPETYRSLHDDYTARAARVLQELDGESVASTAGPVGDPTAPKGRRLTVILGIVTFAVVAGIVLAYGLGSRLPGETITGNQGDRAPEATAREVRRLRADIREFPQAVENRLALARILMGRRDDAGALEQFQQAARIDPTNPEPFAYSGWLIRLQGFPDQGLILVDKALEVSPEYPDARFFKGLILFRDLQNPDAAIAEFQQYLVASPDSPLAGQVRNLLAEAVEAQRPSTSSSTPSSP